MYKFQVSELTNSHSNCHSHEPFNHPNVATNNAIVVPTLPTLLKAIVVRKGVA